ncbi:MAG TPA: hypothetical protein VGM11_04355 [Acidobacteriaceae bacterium]
MAHPSQICTRRYLTDSALVSGVLFQTFENIANEQECIRAAANGKVLFQRTQDGYGPYTLGQKANKEGPIPTVPNGTDLTGRGRPDMLISAWSGGAHCCRTDYIFELRPQFKLLATIDARDADLSHFAKLDDTGLYYYLSEDYIFAYWYGSFAGSPVEPAILEYRDDKNGAGFHLAPDKMRQPAPTREDWDKAMSAVKNDLALKRKNMANDLRTDLWSEVLHLIYTGHSDLAWKFLSDAGPDAQTAPDPSLADFCSTLKASDYWRDLAPTIQNMPAACSSAKPAR